MRESFEIVSASGAYPVEIDLGAARRIAGEGCDAIFLVDSKLVGKFDGLDLKFVEIEATEANKSLDRMPVFVDALRHAGARRDTRIVAVGGGIIQDISTFLASIYMRGLPWIYLPTTVLAMADSCIGGKSSINVLGHKNLVGNFYPPQKILIDLDFVTTLDTEMIVGGLFEAAKICFAHGGEKFDAYLALAPEAARTPEQMGPLVDLALRTKKWFIEVDEFDQKERLLLNFGHTFGHAAEAVTDFGVSHGIGVGLGMLVACVYARQQSLLDAAGERRANSLSDHVRNMLGPLFAEKAFVKAPIDVALAMEKFAFDKKHRADAFRVVVPAGDGALKLLSLPRDAATVQALARAYADTLTMIEWPCS
jgi:3-dehydroquinate synthase